MRRLIVASLFALAACGGSSDPSEPRDAALDDGGIVDGPVDNGMNSSAPISLDSREPTWFYRDDPGGGLALYGEAGGQGQFAIRCDRRGRRVLFQRAATTTDSPEIILSAGGNETRYPARPLGGGTPRLEAAASLDDGTLDRLLSGDSLGVDATGTRSLRLPLNGAVRRVIESCRAPVRQAAVIDGTRYQGSLPCPDCAGIDVTLSFTARGPETERYRLERRRRGGSTELNEGSVELMGAGDSQTYRLTPDNGDTPITLTRRSDGALLLPADDPADAAVAAYALSPVD